MQLFYSIIIPVYNRPEEVVELLESLLLQTYQDFEVLIVEDGSQVTCESQVASFRSKLDIKYYFKPNSGPGDSRNYGMKKANGNYYIILDSDCILPANYMESVDKALTVSYVDCFGGADASHDSFSDIQKAINFSMTSFLTTGGVRGGSEKLGKFQPRSFNMGISKRAFESTGGFGTIHPGEDPDLTFRLWKAGFQSRLIADALVYHKRRIDWDKFKTQVNKFGKVRPILDLWHPGYRKLTFWFPSLFIIGLGLAVILLLFKQIWLLTLYLIYFLLVFILSSIQNKSLMIGLQSIRAILVQFWGYGTGYLLSFWRIHYKKMKPEQAFPELFFK